MRTDLPRQRNDEDRHASDAAADRHARGAGFAPAGGSTATASTTTAAASTLRHDDNRAGTDSAGSAPARSERIQKRPAVVAGRLHPAGDAIEAVRVDGVRALRCTVCSQRLGAYDEDYKRACLMRELPLDTGMPSNGGVQLRLRAARVQLPGMRHCANRRCPGAGGADQRGAALCRSAGACVAPSKVTACSRTPASSIT